MPGMNGKGPMGSGPAGRGVGRCRASAMTGRPNQEAEREQTQQPIAEGRYPGMGRGNRCGGAGRGGRCGDRGQRGGNR